MSDPLALVLLVVVLQLVKGVISCVLVAVQARARERCEVSHRATLVALLAALPKGVECKSEVDAITVSYSRREAVGEHSVAEELES